jgi:large subunit ribosomal protein L35
VGGEVGFALAGTIEGTGEKSVPKQKTHKGAAKRFKVTGGGKVIRHHAMHSHMLTGKTTKRKRNLRKSAEVSTAFAGTLKEMLHN